MDCNTADTIPWPPFQTQLDLPYNYELTLKQIPPLFKEMILSEQKMAQIYYCVLLSLVTLLCYSNMQ